MIENADKIKDPSVLYPILSNIALGSVDITTGGVALLGAAAIDAGRNIVNNKTL